MYPWTSVLQAGITLGEVPPALLLALIHPNLTSVHTCKNLDFAFRALGAWEEAGLLEIVPLPKEIWGRT